jgi:hypothetical protein
MGTPGVGVQGGGYPEQGSWSASFGWRHQKSDRHFVGSHYEEQRDDQESQVINNLNMADVSIRYQATKRVELSLGVPFVMATRSQALRSQGVQLERYQTNARGIGDVVLSARRWMFDPDTHLGGNLQLGVGVKLPTGSNNVTDTFRRLESGTITNVVRTVDQSIQPGDGGFGIIVDYNVFKGMAGGNVTLYSSGAYLANPQETSRVLTYRGGAGERIMSIADQYLLRGGAAFAVPGMQNVSAAAGLRIEGVPVRDLIGGSQWFRRPGIAVSLEPSITFNRGPNGVTVGIPIAIYRNRFVSVWDEERGGHGDAAFADWLLMFGYSRKF